MHSKSSAKNKLTQTPSGRWLSRTKKMVWIRVFREFAMKSLLWMAPLNGKCSKYSWIFVWNLNLFLFVWNDSLKSKKKVEGNFLFATKFPNGRSMKRSEYNVSDVRLLFPAERFTHIFRTGIWHINNVGLSHSQTSILKCHRRYCVTMYLYWNVCSFYVYIVKPMCAFHVNKAVMCWNKNSEDWEKTKLVWLKLPQRTERSCELNRINVVLCYFWLFFFSCILTDLHWKSIPFRKKSIVCFKEFAVVSISVRNCVNFHVMFCVCPFWALILWHWFKLE